MRENFTRRLNEKWSTSPKRAFPYYLSKVSIRDDPDVLEFLKWLYLIPLLPKFLNTKTDYHEL
jgi:hypothetical protein